MINPSRHIGKYHPKSPVKTLGLCHWVIERKDTACDACFGEFGYWGAFDEGGIDMVAGDAEVFEIGEEMRRMTVLDIGSKIKGSVECVEAGEVAVVERRYQEREGIVPVRGEGS